VTLHTGPMLTLDDAERERGDALLARILVRTRPEADCLLWDGKPTRRGYGRTSTRRGRYWLVHRLVFLLDGGTIPEGWVLDHTCRRRLCILPAHLQPVPLVANTARGELYRSDAPCPTCGCTAHQPT